MERDHMHASKKYVKLQYQVGFRQQTGTTCMQNKSVSTLLNYKLSCPLGSW